jgi:hypothetical protein
MGGGLAMVNRAAAVEGGKNATGELLGVDSKLLWGGGDGSWRR